MKSFVADFETTSWSQYLQDKEVRVFAYAIADIDTTAIVNYGTDIEPFFDFLSITRQSKTIAVYFHNLKFDGAFILFYLLSHGYTWTSERHIKDNEVRTLISDTGIWYSIQICYTKANYKIKVNFYDSFKKLPFTVKKIGKAFNLGYTKGDFDYDKYRPKGYMLTDDEWDYLFRDCLVVASALKKQFEQGLTKMTQSSDAYNFFKQKYTEDEFKYFFPQLSRDTWLDLKKAYRGGWVYCNEKIKGKTLYNVISFDYNSLYSYAMSEKFMLPYGNPILYTGNYSQDEIYPLYIQVIDVSFDLKPNYLPTLQIASLGAFSKDQFLTTTDNEIIELSLTNIDLELFLEHHNINYIKYKYGYKFKAYNQFFQDYINYWMEIKQNSTGALREIAKKMLNALYGKFGTKFIRCDKSVSISDNVLHFTNNKETESYTKHYLPIAIFTTANARKVIINLSQKFYNNHAYSDTDSIKLYNLTYSDVSSLIPIDDKKLGFLKFEGLYKQSKFIRAKTYEYIIYEKNEDGTRSDNQHIVCAGMPDKVKEEITEDQELERQERFDKFEIGYNSKNKLQQIMVKGGCVLKPTTYTLKS